MNPNAHTPHNRIPIAVSLPQDEDQAEVSPRITPGKKRMVFIASLAVGIAAIVSCIARLLVHLINLITNISFHQQFSIAPAAPAGHTYGWLVILIPVIGGVVVGLMALYGSKAIRGHGIPEAMEQILTNNSKIRPSITYLKPLSAAISIGTGGPFGAEGPIIATGGALGSTLGQLLRISPYERKILLAAGATAGMSAIFGSPLAAIFLAIELLLFEFSSRSIIPVALACITGAAGHHLLFEAGPVFPTPFIAMPSNAALAAYSVIGLAMGLLAALVTRVVYIIEDAFEKLPVHWMWWPAIGGVVVGITGYFFPRTLGVGYDNITSLLSGQVTMHLIFSLCVMKFISWAVALGSGTSGGTLAPLLTIGGAAGALFGTLLITLFPQAGITITLAVLIGMAAMFAGASRALLTSVIFAIETTDQANALLPLLAACIASYFVSFLLMRNTIMTEKIARRGVATPQDYEPDMLDKLQVRHVLQTNSTVISGDMAIEEVRDWLNNRKEEQQNYYVVVNGEGMFQGIVSASNLFSMHHPVTQRLDSLIKRKPFSITENDSLKTAVQMMADENLDVLPVVAAEGNALAGILSYRDILSGYRHYQSEHKQSITLSLKKRTLRVLVHGKKLLRQQKVP